MPDLDKEEYSKEEQDRREIRRRRRIRNQVIAYACMGIVLAAILVFSGIGIHKGIDLIKDKKQAEELKAQMEQMSEEAEEPITIEAPEETEEPEDQPEQETRSQLDEIVDACIAEMPLEDKVAGLFIITPEALTETDVAVKAGDTTKEKLSKYAVGGLVYFAQNIKSKEQLTELLSGTRGFSKYPLFLAVDEEGGSVSRVAEKGLAENVGSMGSIGESGDTAKAKEAASTIASYLTELGFNFDLAPVADVISEGNTIIGDRSFGNNGGDVGAMVAASVEGLQGGGVSACLKHFPGLGSVSEDTHEGAVSSEKSKEDFEVTDFLSFQAGIDAGAEAVMVSHLSVPNITGNDEPSSVSSKMITEILRNEMNFKGIVITDAMDMKAITENYASDEAAVKALQAGADMILMPEDFEAAYNGVLEAVNGGTLSEERINESLQRIYRVKYKDRAEE